MTNVVSELDGKAGSVVESPLVGGGGLGVDVTKSLSELVGNGTAV